MDDLHELHFRAMGTDCHVIVIGDRSLLEIAVDRVEELEALWSRFRHTSEISELNRNRGIKTAVSIETWLLVTRALEAWRATLGRVDPTVLGDVVRAGYDRGFEAVAISPRNGTSFLRRGAGEIELDRTTRSVTLPHDVGFDPGGLGKGLAADFVVDELMDRGAVGACVNLGGDLRVEGYGPDEGRWIVTVAAPVENDAPICTLGLRAGGVSTSTTARRSWMVDGEQRHHLIDPSTGRSASGRYVQATAVAASAAWAEVAAKSALLAPGLYGIDAIEELGCSGALVRSDGVVELTTEVSQYLTIPLLPKPRGEVSR